MKTFLIVLALALVAPTAALAGTRAQLLSDQFQLNQNKPSTARLGDKSVAEKIHTLRAKYDFAVQGGAVGAVTLLDVSTGKSAVLPKGAIVRHCIIDVITPATTSASGTLALSTGQTAADLKAATAAASYTGLLACVPVGTAASAIKLTADRTMVGAIATGALTAGKLYVIVQYELSDTL
jgi:hypothetical protein